MPPVGFEPLDMPAGSQGYPPTTLHNSSSLGAPCLTSWTLQPDKHENAMPKSIHPNRTLAQDEIRTSRALQQRAANALQQRAHSKRFPSSGDAPCSWSGVWRDPSVRAARATKRQLGYKAEAIPRDEMVTDEATGRNNHKGRERERRMSVRRC